MAATKSTSLLFQKLGQRLVNAHKAHAAAETTYSQFGDPPAGIENGVARLVEAKIDVHKEGDNKGHPFFFLRGVIVLPRDHEGIPCEGIGVSLIEKLYDTPDATSRKTAEDHVGFMYNELRKLGVDTNAIDPANIDATLNALKAQSPHFKFRTWKGQPTPQYPNPRVNTTFMGAVEFNQGEAEDGVDDGTVPPAPASPRATAPAPKANGKPSAPGAAAGTTQTTRTATAPASGRATAPKTGKVAPDVETTYSDAEDLDALLARAGDQDAAATARLSELAQAAGYTEAEVDAATSWDDVVAMINSPKDAGEGGDADADGAGVPAVDDVFYYYPTDPKTKQPGKKKVEVKVTKVNADAGKADIVNLSNAKEKWNGVAFDRLVVE